MRGLDCLGATSKSRDHWRDNIVNTKRNLIHKQVKFWGGGGEHTCSQVLKLLHYCLLCYFDKPDPYIGPCLSEVDPTLDIRALVEEEVYPSTL